MRPGENFSFYVQHRAAPQGSKTLDHGKTGRPFMRESSAGVKPFRTAVRRAAQGPGGKTAMHFFGPVVVSIEFEFLQPKSNKDPYPTAKTIGDIDKLTRAVLDGLVEAKLIEDDALVVGLDHVTKTWGPRDGAYISVRSAVLPEPVSGPPIVDFAEAIGTPLDRWQQFILDEIKPVGPKEIEQLQYDAQLPPDPISPEPPYAVCCNTVDHKSCKMFGTDNCPCPRHCPA
jgi:Holliday junction resolvase RusA-like endonuclease